MIARRSCSARVGVVSCLEVEIEKLPCRRLRFSRVTVILMMV